MDTFAKVAIMRQSRRRAGGEPAANRQRNGTRLATLFPLENQPLRRNIAMANSKLLTKLNDILRHEWTGVAQYAQAGFLVAGLWREVYSKMFLEGAEESFGHAKTIGDKIVALGGVPTVERNPVKQSNDLQEMLEFSLEFESKAVQLYNEALALAEADRALVVLLEDILLEEQEGVDHITKLVREHKAASASGSGKSRSKTG
jgi:bacterioferritin